MIEFKGTLSDKCRKFITKRFCKLISYLMVITMAIVMIVLGIGGVIIESKFLIDFSMLYGAIMIFVLPIFTIWIFSTKKGRQEYIPERIYINADGGTLGVSGKKFKRTHSTNDVKQIVDYGEWYVVVFFFGSKDLSFVIQKDLITKGTIAEFENLFSDKIVPAKKMTN